MLYSITTFQCTVFVRPQLGQTELDRITQMPCAEHRSLSVSFSHQDVTAMVWLRGYYPNRRLGAECVPFTSFRANLCHCHVECSRFEEYFVF